MVSKSVVDTMHSEIKTLLDEAQRHSESPRLIAVISILERLTNLNPDAVPAPDCKHEHVVQGVCQDCGGELPSLMVNPPAQPTPPAECSHPDISPFGVCRVCGTCLHQFRSADGTCHQCGEKVELQPVPVPQQTDEKPTDDAS
jgi:hypothetical protein